MCIQTDTVRLTLHRNSFIAEVATLPLWGGASGIVRNVHTNRHYALDPTPKLFHCGSCDLPTLERGVRSATMVFCIKIRAGQTRMYTPHTTVQLVILLSDQ